MDGRTPKYIFITGGVVSSLGKGLAAASIGCLLEGHGYKVTMQKFDPYINVDPGTMSPYQHGEVFVTDDGGETDLDLGHYERFTNTVTTKHSNWTLVAHGVQFVVIGGAGIQSHGRRYDTLDIDVTPDRDEANLRRLADALNELECRLVTDPANTAAWVQLPPDYFTPRSLLAATVWNLATRYGQLDLTFAPSGFPDGYGELAPRAEHLTVAGTRIAVLVAALADIHKSKRVADRPKDRAYFLAAGEPGRE